MLPRGMELCYKPQFGLALPMRKEKKIGLLADSHGNLAATAAAIESLESGGAEKLYHLGDLFDSIKSNDFSGMLSLLEKHRVECLKGNNDHQVEMALKNGGAGLPAEAERHRTAAYLAELPARRVLDPVCLSHSLPYGDVRSCYEPIDDGTTRRAEALFAETGYFLVCCGHCHQPVLFTLRPDGVQREPLTGRDRIFFLPRQRYILIVGSVEEGECGILDLSENIYQRRKTEWMKPSGRI